MVKNMAETEKINIVNFVVYGGIAGVIGGTVDVVLKFLASSINLGKFDDIDFVSQQYLGTIAGNPNVVGVFIIGIISWAFLGIAYSTILYLLMTRSGWDRDLIRYFIVAIVIGVVLTILTLSMALSMAEFDLIIDIPLQFIIGVFSMTLLAPIVYYLEERFESAS